MAYTVTTTYTKINDVSTLPTRKSKPAQFLDHRSLCGCIASHRSGGPEKDGFISCYVYEFLHWSICIISSELCLDRAPKFIFTLRHQPNLNEPNAVALDLKYMLTRSEIWGPHSRADPVFWDIRSCKLLYRSWRQQAPTNVATYLLIHIAWYSKRKDSSPKLQHIF